MRPRHCARVRPDFRTLVRGAVCSYRDLVVRRAAKVWRNRHVTVALRNAGPVVSRDGRIVVLRVRRLA